MTTTSNTQALLAHRIEEAALNSWPGLQQSVFDGWILRFSRGHTKRANSVNPLYESHLDLETKIAACEARYAAQGLPAVFRLPSITTPPALDGLLAERGYRQMSHTLVQHRDLHADLPQTVDGVALHDETLDDWLALYCQLRGEPLARHDAHRAILDAITAQCWWVTLRAGETVLACGVAVMELPFVGLFDLFTHPEQRGKGYGTAMVAGLLERARDQGADHAYLQVEADNTIARHIYAHTFGYKTVYDYWYRVPG